MRDFQKRSFQLLPESARIELILMEEAAPRGHGEHVTRCTTNAKYMHVLCSHDSFVNINPPTDCQCFSCSLLRRRTIWTHIAFWDWAMMFALCVFYQVGTPWLDSLSIPQIGSPLYSAMLPFRMVRAFDEEYERKGGRVRERREGRVTER